MSSLFGSEDVARNPQVADLFGESGKVILSASERMQEQSSTKSKTERQSEPVFDVVIEMISHIKWRTHRDVAESVDAMMNDSTVNVEIRELLFDDTLGISYESFPR